MKYYKVYKQIAERYGIDAKSHNTTEDGMIVVNEKEVTVLDIKPVTELKQENY